MDSSRAHYHEKTADRSRRVDPETSSTKTRSMSAPQPRSQRAPVNCCGQRHVYVPATPSWQVPPFRHGADSHLHIQPTTSTFLHTHAYIIDMICLLHTHTHTHPFNGLLSWTTRASQHQKRTRSSAIAEGPRDASCQLKSCQLPRNSAETIRRVLNKSKL